MIFLNNKKFYTALYSFAVIAGLLLFASCGDDSSSSPKKFEVIDEVETFDDLVKCSEKLYGAEIFVKEEDETYECTEDGWVAASEEGNDSEEEIKPSEKDTEVIEIKKVDSIFVVGVAEKGPFAKNGTVVLTGLDSNLAKTKKTFKSVIADDKGNFEIKNVSLESQYALIEVNGPFFSEVDGKKTSGKVTLKALVDLSAGDTVRTNVNVLTDLEYARALELVNQGYNVPAAKKRATREIAKAFGVKVDGVTVTTVSLADSGKAALALYSASIALLGNLPVTMFQTRQKKLSASFAGSGIINDTLRAEIADYLSEADFVAIRKNVPATAPLFESVLYAFWTAEFKLPECSEKNEATVEKNPNTLSENFESGYACVNNYWHKSSSQDTEFGLCVADKNGEYKKSEKEGYYLCQNGKWNEISVEDYELKDCSNDRKGEYAEANEKFFVCGADNVWREIDALTFELKDCFKQDSSMLSVTNGKKYICDANEGSFGWRTASDVEFEYGTCIASKNYVKLSSGEYYLCKNNEWKTISALEYELQTCSKQDSTLLSKVDNQKYICDANTDNSFDWRVVVNNPEYEFGVCNSQKNLKRFASSEAFEFYVCQDGSWSAIDRIKYEYGFCENSNNGEFVGNDNYNEHYQCVNGVWSAVTNTEYKLKKRCETHGDGVSANGSHYFCYENSDGKKDWVLVENGESCPSDFLQQYVNVQDLYAVCKPAGWELVTKCRYDNKNETTCEFVSGDCTCENGKWRDANEAESRLNRLCTSSNSGIFLKNDKGIDYYYECAKNSSGVYAWSEGWHSEIDVNGSPTFFKTTITDSRDNQKYNVSVYGSKIWMASNLNYETENSKKYPTATLPAIMKIYGRYYLYTEALSTTVCPSGFHIPSNTEWEFFNDVEMANALSDYKKTLVESGYLTKDFTFKEGNASFWSSNELETELCGMANNVGKYAADKDFYQFTVSSDTFKKSSDRLLCGSVTYDLKYRSIRCVSNVFKVY